MSKTSSLKTLFCISMLFLSLTISGQKNPPIPTPPPPPPPLPAPIDGGLAILFASGVALGVGKLYKKKD